MNEISTLKAKYFELGRELDVPAYELETLERQYGPFNRDQAFIDVLLLWLRGRSTRDRTWQALVRAVASKTGGNNWPLAKEIADRHTASKLSRRKCEQGKAGLLKMRGFALYQHYPETLCMCN